MIWKERELGGTNAYFTEFKNSKVFGSKSAIWFMDSVLKAKRIAFYVINKLKVTLVHYR